MGDVDEHRQAVDRTDATLDLRQPTLGPPNQPSQHELGQPAPSAVDGDTLANRHVLSQSRSTLSPISLESAYHWSLWDPRHTNPDFRTTGSLSGWFG